MSSFIGLLCTVNQRNYDKFRSDAAFDCTGLRLQTLREEGDRRPPLLPPPLLAFLLVCCNLTPRNPDKVARYDI